MASARQIAANRLNAKKGTGPKSRAGKQRTRNNAYQHGLAAARGRETSPEIEELARKFAGDAVDPITIELAREAAQAQFDLANINLLKIAWVHRAYLFGCTERPDDLKRILASPNWRELLQPSSTPPPGPERLSEAVRRALPELTRLWRYEARAIARRDRAIREIIRSKNEER